MTGQSGTKPIAAPSLPRALAVWGPGLLVMLADTDAGNVVTAADAGARFGYRLLPLTLLLAPALYLIQELTLRLGIATGRGHAELIRERYGLFSAGLAVTGLAVAAIGSLVTEFTGVAGVGEMFGAPRAATLPLAAVALLAIVGLGAYRRVERAALVIGLFELAFFFVAWKSQPDFAAMARHAVSLPIRNRHFALMAAGIIGATFNPWMIFYQQSATVDKGLRAADLPHARADTGVGAVLTQCLTGAVLIAVAASFAGRGASADLASIGDIAAVLAPTLGVAAGKFVFGAGVLGASLVAAIVASLALAWGVGEIFGLSRTLERRPFAGGWFYGAYAGAVAGSALVVWAIPDLVALNVAAQALNAILAPIAIGFLVALAATMLPEPLALSRARLWLVSGAAFVVSSLGVVAAIRALV